MKKKLPSSIGTKTVKVERKAFKKSVVTENEKKTQFKAGNKLGGRTKGSRNKFAEAFFTDMQNDWQEHGIEAIKAVRVNDPSTYLRVAATLMPKELNINEADSELDRILERYSDEELDKLVNGLVALGSEQVSQQGDATKDKTSTRDKSTRLH